jgi:HEAT repeat protein
MLSLLDWSTGRLVEALGNVPRAGAAYHELLRRGPAAVFAIREGLRHADAGVRKQCCRLLDQFLDQDAFEDMLAMLKDVDVGVRVNAAHALACDRCKRDACRPGEAAVLGPGIRLLEDDPNPHVRAMAVELVGRFVHSNADAVEALARAVENDPSPAVRKKASWYAPGGPIFRRTAPRSSRAPTFRANHRTLSPPPNKALQAHDHLGRSAPSVARR